MGVCDDSTNGVLIIPTSDISSPSKPDGFWNIKATSPNYCLQLDIYRNATNNPADNKWNQENIILSGDYVNITAKINPSILVNNYIDQTNAILYIRFPNGSLWSDKIQVDSVDTDGTVNFNYFQIPKIEGYNYIAGEYEAIITWNNSFSSLGINETGIIYKKFTVVHDSILEPHDGVYYIENILDSGILNIKVFYKDKEDFTAIRDAHVYIRNATNDILNFSESTPGLYIYEFDTRKASAGNNTFTIYANSTFYQNKIINITVDITKQTILTVDKFYKSVPSNDNFSILFNYTELNSPDIGIDTSDYSTNWQSDYNFVRIAQGSYNITCNTSSYETNRLHTLILQIKAYRYEAQSAAIRIYVSELGSQIKLYVNNTLFAANDIYNTDVYQDINITIKYEDTDGNHINGANVSLLRWQDGAFTEQSGLGQYSKIINASDLGQGLDTLTIFANKSNYNPLTTQFIVQITEKASNIDIFLNGVNRTTDPTISLPISSILNIRINYTDSDKAHIGSADVELSGKGVNVDLAENVADGLYSTSINTVSLSFGTNILTVDASKTNYEPITKNIRVIIRKINTEIKTEDDEDDYEIRPGESFTLTIELTDLDFGGKIEDADVTYDAKFGSGDLEEVDDGVYEVVLENIEEGSYTIDIYVAKEGGLYEFKDFKVSLTVETPEGEAMLFIIAFIIAASVSGSLATYFIAYRYWLQYPKPVRKIRKYRRTLKRKKNPYSVADLSSREKSFGKLFKEHTSGIVKSKISQKTPGPDKLTKKSSQVPKEEAK